MKKRSCLMQNSAEAERMSDILSIGLQDGRMAAENLVNCGVHPEALLKRTKL